MLALFILLLLAPPFWEARPVAQWTDEELQEMLHNSPWAQAASAPLVSSGVQAYLATAQPIRQAERELARRSPRRKPAEDSTAEEYEEFLRQNQGRNIVLAVLLPRWDALAEAAEAERMERECILKVGRKKYKLVGHFPPTPSDPYLRLVYPRAVTAADKAFSFELYLPSVPTPYRALEFRVKDLVYKGKLEM